MCKSWVIGVAVACEGAIIPEIPYVGKIPSRPTIALDLP